MGAVQSMRIDLYNSVHVYQSLVALSFCLAFGHMLFTGALYICLLTLFVFPLSSRCNFALQASVEGKVSTSFAFRRM